MSWLLFLDESGHDHRHTPFEVRGGIAIHSSKLWNFLQGWRRLEEDCFGTLLSNFGKEAKGQKLLDRDRFKWAAQAERMDDSERRKCARRFLELGNSSSKPSRSDFTAYGQASLEMARGAFDLLDAHGAKLFATMIPRGIKKPTGFTHEEFLRKDHVFLFERYFYFLESQKEYGLIVMDETDKSSDRKFVGQMEGYFRRTATGRNRSAWIVPSPMFVASDMTYAVQAADICLYCINWGFREARCDDTHEYRLEIMDEFAPKVSKIQWSGDGYRDGNVFRSHGITMVPDPYTSRVRT